VTLGVDKLQKGLLKGHYNLGNGLRPSWACIIMSVLVELGRGMVMVQMEE